MTEPPDPTALTSLQELELDRAFAHLDVDGDRQIEREDVLALGARLLIGFGEAPTSTKGKDLVASLDGLWHGLLDELDLGRDGRLTIDDFRDGMAGAFVHGGRYDPVLGPVVEAVARLCDTDDGEVGLDELRTLHDALGLDGGVAELALAKLDLDDSGRITTADLSEAARDYYTSSDPEAPGNSLFGPLDPPTPTPTPTPTRAPSPTPPASPPAPAPASTPASAPAPAPVASALASTPLALPPAPAPAPVQAASASALVGTGSALRSRS